MKAFEFKPLGGTANRALRWSYENGQFVGVNATFLRLEEKVRCCLKDMLVLTLADEANGVGVTGALGWGTVGAVVAGPVGAVVGGILGGRKENVTFVATFPDSSTMMAQVPKKVWIHMMAERL